MRNINKGIQKGFTLIELLIVIAIIAVLATVVVVAINPVETLKESRDTQRLSDLATIKSALGLYTATAANPSMDGGTGTKCAPNVGQTIFASIPSGTTIGSAPTGWAFNQVAITSLAKVDTTGWVPVNLNNTKGGSPISNLPIDPTNTTNGTPSNAQFYYRYVCGANNTFEVATAMESDFYKPGCTMAGCKDFSAQDGGNNASFYEVGTNLTLVPATNNF